MSQEELMAAILISKIACLCEVSSRADFRIPSHKQSCCPLLTPIKASLWELKNIFSPLEYFLVTIGMLIVGGFGNGKMITRTENWNNEGHLDFDIKREKNMLCYVFLSY